MVSKREKSQKLVETIKLCDFLKLKREDMLDVIEYHTGKKLNLSELDRLLDELHHEAIEEQIEVDTFMEHMVQFGLFLNQMRQQKMLETLESVIFTKIMKETVKGDSGNWNLILNCNSNLLKVFEAKNNSIMNMGYLKKAREVIEQQNKSELSDRVKIRVEKNEQEVQKLVDKQIDTYELESNRIA